MRAPRLVRALLLAVAGISLAVALVSGWAHTTLYDSDRFSERTVDLLSSPAVRKELTQRLTEQLALSGNRQAVNFRPAYELAIEAVIQTDSFRSIFRTAVRKTHSSLLVGNAEGAALDLSDSVSIIASTLQLPTNAEPGQAEQKSMGSSLDDVVRRVDQLGVLRLRDLTATAFYVGLGIAALAAALAVALATDRQRAMAHAGWVVVAAGVAVSALVVIVQWFVRGAIADERLAAAVSSGVWRAMSDLRMLGIWTAGYGLVVAAAAATLGGSRRVTPASAARAVVARTARVRATTAGSVALGALAVVGGLIVVSDPSLWTTVAMLAAGMYLVYFGVTELLGLVRSSESVPAVTPVEGTPEEGAPDEGTAERPRRVAVLASVIGGLLAAVTVGLVLSTGQAAQEAEAAGNLRCNGVESLCDVRLDRAIFPGTHNSMSSALYPGWLFAEHVKTIGGQLESGVRALLIDTHYGVLSSAKLPGSDTPVVLTDRAAELVSPTGEGYDQAIADRAAQLASRAPRRADASRALYLCHNFCEMGAVRFGDALAEIESFVGTHPDDVVIIDIQDATTPADTAAAIEAAGLGDEAYTLDPGRPLPTLGDIVRSGRNLLVFAEGGGPGAPPWYHMAYEHWFQETPYAFNAIGEMSCGPNRGPSDAPLFLVNHWLMSSPPDPAKALTANREPVLDERIRRCLAERDLLPNVVAVDFSEQGQLVKTLRQSNEALLDEVEGRRPGGGEPQPVPSPATTAPPTEPGPIAPQPPIPAPTVVTTLTGGNPGPFCADGPAARTAVGAWAQARLVAPASGQGLPDLAYGPAVARALDAVQPVTPDELVRQFTPVQERARAAVRALDALGVPATVVAELADLADARLSAPDSPDPVVVQEALLEPSAGCRWTRARSPARPRPSPPPIRSRPGSSTSATWRTRWPSPPATPAWWAPAGSHPRRWLLLTGRRLPAGGPERHQPDQGGEIQPRRRRRPLDLVGITGQGDELEPAEDDVGQAQGPQAPPVVLPCRLAGGEADDHQPGADGPAGEDRERPRPPLQGVGRDEHKGGAEHRDPDGDDAGGHPQPSGEGRQPGRVAPSDPALPQEHGQHRRRQQAVGDEPRPAEERVHVEGLEVHQGHDEGRRGEHQHRRQWHPRHRPELLAGRDPVETGGREVAGAQEGGGQRRADRPREQGVGVLGEHEQVEPGRQHQHGAGEEQPARRRRDRGHVLRGHRRLLGRVLRHRVVSQLHGTRTSLTSMTTVRLAT